MHVASLSLTASKPKSILQSMSLIQGNQWLEEARRIRAEQDQAFAESLAVDQAKVVCGLL